MGSTLQGLANVVKWVKEMKDIEEEVSDKMSFLAEFEVAFKDEIHTDILVKPGNNGPPIPAHRALLVRLSSFKLHPLLHNLHPLNF